MKTPPVFRVTRHGTLITHSCARCPYTQTVSESAAGWARHKAARDNHDCGGGK